MIIESIFSIKSSEGTTLLESLIVIIIGEVVSFLPQLIIVETNVTHQTTYIKIFTYVYFPRFFIV